MVLFPQQPNLAPVREKCIKLICTFERLFKKLEISARVVNRISNKTGLFKIDFGSHRESRRMSSSNTRLLLLLATTVRR